MFKKILLITLCTLFSLQAKSYEVKEKIPVISIDADYMGIFRNTIEEITTLCNTYSSGALLYPDEGFEEISQPYASGAKIIALFTPSPKWSLEALFMGFIHWSRHCSFTNHYNLWGVPTNPYSLNDWTLLNYFAYRFQSNLNMGDLSLWIHKTPPVIDYFSFSWMVGLKYIDFRDRIKYTAGISSIQDNWFVKIVNNMVGGQIGIELQSNPSRRLSLGMQGRFAVYANWMTRTNTLYDNDNTTLVVNNKKTHVFDASSIYLTPYILCKAGPFYLRLGYDFFILFRPGMAPEQVKPFHNANTLYPVSKMYLQAFTVGAGFAW